MVMSNQYCPTCEQPNVRLGTLGSLDHYRCRQCGDTWSVPVSTGGMEVSYDDHGLAWGVYGEEV